MRFLADENVAGGLVRALRARGHDVSWVLELARGSSDESVLGFCRAEGRILLTCDKDFGELAYHRGLISAAGIILLRASLGPSPESMAKIADILSSRNDWTGHFSVIELDRIRMRPIS